MAGSPPPPIEIAVNGQAHTVQAATDTPVLYVLRNELGLHSPAFGCGLGKCGSCTVLVDGQPVRSCETPVGEVAGSVITTVEGLGSATSLHPIQQAFLDEQAAQCGYCIPGMMMTATALLEANPHPTETEIREALERNLCRCGTHTRILKAVQRATGTTPGHRATGVVPVPSPMSATRPQPGQRPAETGTVEPGLVAMPATQTPQDVQTRNVADDTVDTYLEIEPNGNVTVYAGKVELGTGIRTALAQIVAEELDLAFARVTLVMGDTATTPNQGTTAGSKTLQVAGPVLRQAAAEARRILLARASERLGVPVDALEAVDGTVRSCTDPGLCVGYGELATTPFGHAITGDAPLKPLAEHRIVGQSVPRVDLLAKLTGGETFVHDLTLDGMLHGRVVRPHRRTLEGIGGKVEHIDDSALQGMPGIVAVVRNGDFVGVVAEREEQAIAAARALRVTWSGVPDLPGQADHFERLRQAPAETREVVRNGDAASALDTAAVTHAATFHQSWQAHASMGPSCAVADVREDSATIWSSSQNVYSLGQSIAPILGLGPEQVRVIFREGAGCYGHNGSDDASADAAVLSQAVGKPVRVQWMRQDEFAWEPKGPAMITDLRAGLDDEGNILAWQYEVWTPTHTTRPGGEPSRLFAAQLVDPPFAPASYGQGGGDRNAPTVYAFPNNQVTVHWTASPPLRHSSLRSLGGYHNATANEIFMDEMAHLARADPVEFRLRHLTDPRAIAVIEEVAALAGWTVQSPPETPAPPGEVRRGRGVAFARYETAFAYVATVAEVEVDPATGAIRVPRVFVAHDCGQIVNPDGVRNQVEGNIIQGMSRALTEEVTWDTHGVTSLTWAEYRILTFADVPQIEIAPIDRPEEPAWGAGEPAICTIAAAISNAVYNATGVRLRTVPYTPERVLAALQAGTEASPGPGQS